MWVLKLALILSHRRASGSMASTSCDRLRAQGRARQGRAGQGRAGQGGVRPKPKLRPKPDRNPLETPHLHNFYKP